MNRYLNELSGVSPSDAQQLSKVDEALPIVADLCHADLLLYIAGNQPNTAVVIAQACPHTVSSLFASPMVGKQVGKKNEPLVFHAMKRGSPARSFRELPARGIRTAQEALPLKGSDGKVIAVLSIEANAIEHDRLKRKSQVLRKALLAIVDMATAGHLVGVGTLTPIGEHEGLMVVDGTGQIVYVSSITENLYRKLGYSGGLPGARLADMATDEGIVFEAMESGRCIEREISQRGLVCIKKVIPLMANDGTPWLSHHIGCDCQYGGAFVVVNDITEQREREQALKIKSAMIQEIHHRVKNNLQTIAALLRLQARRVDKPEVQAMLGSSINRILSVAVVHEFLSHDEDTVINIREVCQRILTEVMHGILDPDKGITLRLEGMDLYLPAQQATSCALVVNELLQNAVKHGYVGRDSGTVVVRLMEKEDELSIEIADDGVGFPETFDSSGSGHLGLQIINSLVKEDLRGRLELANGHGVTARVTFPRLAAAPSRSQ